MAGRKPKLNATRTSVLLNNEVLDYLKSTGNASAEIERIVRDEMDKSKGKTIDLVNPWSGVTAKQMTVAQIEQWGKEHVHPTDLGEWITEARKAAQSDDGETLGKMIIGS